MSSKPSSQANEKGSPVLDAGSTLIGVAIFVIAVVAFTAMLMDTDDTKARIITTAIGTVATIVGFFFGQHAASKGTREAHQLASEAHAAADDARQDARQAHTERRRKDAIVEELLMRDNHGAQAAFEAANNRVTGDAGQQTDYP